MQYRVEFRITYPRRSKRGVLKFPARNDVDEDFDDADLKVTEDVASSMMLLAQQQLQSNDPKASISTPSTRTHTMYIDIFKTPIQ